MLSGLLFYFGWPSFASTFLLFFAFVPLFIIENRIESNKSYWLHVWLAMFIWNASCTWWIYYATAGGMVMAVIANSLLMTVPFGLYRFTKRSYGQRAANLSFVIYWLAFEYFHLNWDLSWPWLTLGNAFSASTWMIQWYEYTGVLGGTLWLLVLNVWIFDVLRHETVKRIRFTAPVLTFVIPVLISWSIDLPEMGAEEEVVVLQPNIDPYNAKFEGSEDYMPYEDQLKLMLQQASESITPQTKYVLAPETAIQGNHQISNLKNDRMVWMVREFVQKHPHVNYLTGIELIEWYRDESKLPEQFRTSRNGHKYNTFNAAMYLNAVGDSIYKKSKFVPGAEQLPYPKVLGFVLKIINFDQYGMYVPQKERTAFYTQDSIAFAPIICYESIFGDFVAEHVRNGANYLFIITNDGWWADTDGHRQHNMYAKLRAIEFRRYVARSANTGISSVIDPKGNTIVDSKWWTRDVLSAKIRPIKTLTYYAQQGDYIGRIAAFMAIGFMVSAFVRKRINRK